MTNPQKATALIVEDHVANQNLLKSQLQYLGCDADIAENGQQALEMLEKKHYPLILSDFNMPVMNGMELAKKLRSQPRFDDIFLLGITANSVTHDVTRQYQQAGFNQVIQKPIDLQLLRQIVDTHANCSTQKVDSDTSDGNVMETPTAHTGQNSSQTEAPRIDLSVIHNYVGNKPELAQQMVQFFCSQTQNSLNDIQQAIAHKQGQTVAALAHKLKSPARTVGALAVARTAESLQHAAEKNSAEPLAEILTQLQNDFFEYQQFVTQQARF